MGQGNEIELMAGVGDAEFLADDGVEFLEGDELLDGKFADGEDELGLKYFDFALEPGRAIADFLRRGDAVAAGGFFARKTAADSGHVDGGAEGLFAQAGGFVKPAEKGFACGPGKGPAEHGFFVAGGLADEEDFAGDGAAADDGALHLRAEAAGAEAFDVVFQQARCRIRIIARGHIHISKQFREYATG